MTQQLSVRHKPSFIASVQKVILLDLVSEKRSISVVPSPWKQDKVLFQSCCFPSTHTHPPTPCSSASFLRLFLSAAIRPFLHPSSEQRGNRAPLPSRVSTHFHSFISFQLSETCQRLMRGTWGESLESRGWVGFLRGADGGRRHGGCRRCERSRGESLRVCMKPKTPPDETEESDSERLFPSAEAGNKEQRR